MTSAPPRRADCPRCLRPASGCICRHVREIDNDTELLILQHPLEQRQAKGTARLLHLCLRNSRLVVGERFEPGLLRELLGSGPSVLLYPDTSPGEAGRVLGAETRKAEPVRQLVLIDGTWRKSRKMLALNPVLQALPRLSWLQPPATRYRVRRAQREHQLSSLEAAALALEQLDELPAGSLPLWDAFDGLMEQLARRAGD